MTKTWTSSELYSLLQPETVYSLLKTSPSGLSESEANSRLLLAGLNIIHTQSAESFGQKVLAQVNNPLILLLLGSATVSLLIGHVDDAISIALAVAIVSAGMLL